MEPVKAAPAPAAKPPAKSKEEVKKALVEKYKKQALAKKQAQQAKAPKPAPPAAPAKPNKPTTEIPKEALNN